MIENKGISMSINENKEVEVKKKLVEKYGSNDERQTAIVSNAAIITLVLTLFLVIGKMAVNYVMTKEIQTWDIILMLFIICVFTLGCMKDKAHFVPKNKGVELNKSGDKKLRIKLYIRDAVQFALVMTILEIIGYFIIGDDSIGNFQIISSLSPELSYIICALASAVGMFVIAIGVNYLLGEHSVKKYNKYLDKFGE